MGRFYDIVVTPAQTAANESPAAYRHWTTLSHGKNDPGALDVELDVLSYANANSGTDGSTVTIHGVPLDDITQAQQFAGMNITVKAGMSKGLPLADPRQAGLILNGQIFQSWANWVGTQMDLNFLVYASKYTYTKPGNIVLNWKQGADLQTALQATLGVAYPDLGIIFALSKPYILTRPVVHIHSTLAGLAQIVASTTKTATFPGVSVSTPINNTIIVSDGLSEQNPKVLKFTDLVGQPTWLEQSVMTVTTVMRADIQIGSRVKMPQGLVDAPGIVTTTSAARPAQLDYKSAFQGQFIAQSIRHVGNFRDPRGESWVTVLKCAPVAFASVASAAPPIAKPAAAASTSGGTLIAPIAGSSWANNGGYDADTGLDIRVPSGTPAIAAADGIVEYAERGHTGWVTPPDTPNSVRIRLNNPVILNGITYRWIWYTHLSAIDASIKNLSNVPIAVGAPVGLTGLGNRVPHLHFGVLVDQGQVRTMAWRDIATIIWGVQPAHG